MGVIDLYKTLLCREVEAEMATGLQMYDALWAVIRELPEGSEFVVNAIEAYDLEKVTDNDLLLRGYSETIAKKVSSALSEGDLRPLGRIGRVRLTKSHEAPRLLPD